MREPSESVAANELSTLVLFARRELDPVTRDRLGERLKEGIDWSRLSSLAYEHGLLPLLARHLSLLEDDLVPSGTRRELLVKSSAITASNLAHLAELLMVLDQMKRQDVVAISIKGPVLAVTLYGDLGSRMFTDLDLLVAPESVPRALQVLRSMKYSPQVGWSSDQLRLHVESRNELPLRREQGGSALDVHWRLFPSHFPCSLEEVGLWERRRVVQVKGQAVEVMSREDELLYLLHHGFRHRWNRLEWLCGIAEILRQGTTLDWDAIVARADRVRMRRVLGVGLSLAATILGAPVPERVHRLSVDAPVRSLSAEIEESIMRRDPPESSRKSAIYQARGMDRLSDRASLLTRIIFAPTPAEWRAVSLGRFGRLAYPVLRLLRLLLKGLGYMKERVSGSSGTTSNQ